MGKLKGYIHHVAEGANFMAAARADADVAVAVAFVGAAAGAVGVVGIGVVGVGVAAVVVAGAAAAGVAGIFAFVGAAATKPYKDLIPAGTQITCRRIGAGLLAAFTIACGGGAGYAVSQKIDKTNSNAASTSPTSPHRDFAVQVSGKDSKTVPLLFQHKVGLPKLYQVPVQLKSLV